MANLNKQMPVSIFDDLEDVTLSQEEISQINLLNSETECLRLKKALEKSQTKIVRLRKEIKEIIEIKVHFETKNNSARSCIQSYLDDGSFNNGTTTEDRFRNLLVVLETRKCLENETTQFEPAVDETESISTVKTKSTDLGLSVRIRGKRPPKLPPVIKDNSTKKRQRKSMPGFDATIRKNIISKICKTFPKYRPVQRKVAILKAVPLTRPPQIAEPNALETPLPTAEIATDGNMSKTSSTNIYPPKSATMSAKQNQRFHLDEESSNCTQMSKQSAMGFFSNALQRNFAHKDAFDVIERLCERLECEPRAMRLAVAYINDNLQVNQDEDPKETIERYLNAIEKVAKRRDHKLPDCEDIETVYNNPTYLTWKMTFDKLENLPLIGEKSHKIMKMMSFLSPDNIFPQFVLNLYHKIENCEVEESIFQFLKDYSMIDYSPGQQILVNREIQEVTRIHLTDNGEFFNMIHKVLHGIQEMFEEDVSLGQLPHAQAIWKHAENNSEVIEEHAGFPICIFIGLYNSGRYSEAYEFSCGALNTFNNFFGEDDQSIIYLEYCKGIALGGLGQYLESVKLLTEVYKKHKISFGDNDEISLWIADEIGFVYCKLNNNEDAMKWYKNALEESERINGKEHSRTLSLRKRVALVLGDEGKFKEALIIYQEVMAVEERVKGMEDEEMLTTKSYFARLKCGQKNYEDALRMFQDVLEVEERVLDRDHPHTLTTKYWIAETFKSLGRIEESFQLAKEVYEKRIEILGPQHPDTISIKKSVESLNLLVNRKMEHSKN